MLFSLHPAAFAARLTVVLIFVTTGAGCAPFSSAPPSPPLAVPIPGSPDEYVYALPQWKPGARVTGKYHKWVEAWQGDRALLKDTHQGIYTFKGIDRTARGLNRVELSVDGGAIGFALMGDDGNPADLVVTNPKVPKDTKETLEAMVSPWFWHLMPLRLPRGQRTRVRVPSSAELKQLPFAWPSSASKPLVLEVEYMGLVEFQGTRVAALRIEWRNILPWSVVHGRMQIDRADFEGIIFLDPATGLTVVDYSKGTAWGQLDGKPAMLHIIEKSVLDRDSSGGF